MDRLIRMEEATFEKNKVTFYCQTNDSWLVKYNRDLSPDQNKKRYNTRR